MTADVPRSTDHSTPTATDTSDAMAGREETSAAMAGPEETLAAADTPAESLQRLDLRLANRLEQIPVLCEAVEAYCSALLLPEALSFHLMLALDEVVTNIISYGFPADGEHEIVVRIDRQDNHLIAEVIDDGRPFDPREVPPPDLDSALDQRAVGGLGIHLVRKLMDAINYQREHGRNRLTMSIRIGQKHKITA